MRGGPTPGAAAATFVPTQLTLPSFRVNAQVTTAMTVGGVLQPPDDPTTLAYWIAGAPAGSITGDTVIVGHVDGPQGPGAFYRLVHVRPGDPVVVSGAQGRTITYRVSSLSLPAKRHSLPAELFARDGPPQLVLISCGGSFDRATDEYADNVVVVAVPN